jgi:hypothetical protein
MFSRYSFLPLTSRLRAKLNRGRSIWKYAAEKIELAPADESPALPIIALPGEFERVLDLAPLTTLALEQHYVSATQIKQGPTIGYRFDDALLADNTLYAAGCLDVARSGNKRPLLLGKYDEFDEAQLCAHSPSNIYFGHWLRDALAMELLAEQRRLLGLCYVRKSWLHEPGYREITRLPGFPVSFALVRKLWVIDDRGLNASWIMRFNELRRRVRSVAHTEGPTRVFLSRGRSGTSRELLNDHGVMNALVARGFVCVEPEALSARQIVDSLASAKIVVSVEGSALNHAQFALPRGAAILVIQPPKRFTAFHKQISDFSGIRFGYVVGDSEPAGFTLELDRLLRTLDLVEAAV